MVNILNFGKEVFMPSEIFFCTIVDNINYLKFPYQTFAPNWND